MRRPAFARRSNQNNRCRNREVPNDCCFQQTDSRRDGYGVQPHAKRSAQQPRTHDRDNSSTDVSFQRIDTKGARKGDRKDIIYRVKPHTEKIPGSTLDNNISFRDDNLRFLAARRAWKMPAAGPRSVRACGYPGRCLPRRPPRRSSPMGSPIAQFLRGREGWPSW